MTSSPSGLIRSIPDHLKAPICNDCISSELKENIYSWRGGLRPVRSRIEALTHLEETIAKDLVFQLTGKVELIQSCEADVSHLDREIGVLNVCIMNSRRSVKEATTGFVLPSLRLLQMSRRRSRIRTLEAPLSQLSAIKSTLDSISKGNIVKSFSSVEDILNQLPTALKIKGSLQMRLREISNKYRCELWSGLTSTVFDRSQNTCSKFLSSYGFGPESLLNSPAVMWYESPIADESQLVGNFISAYLSRVPCIFANFANWERQPTPDGACHCAQSVILQQVLSNIISVFGHVPAIHEHVVHAAIRALMEMYIVYISLSFCDIGFMTVDYADLDDLVQVHEVWLKRQRLRSLYSLVSGRMQPYLHTIFKMRFRSKSLKLADVCVAVESVRSLIDYSDQEGIDTGDLIPIYRDLAACAYAHAAEASLAHGVAAWREFDMFPTEDANIDLVHDIVSFLSVLRTTGGGAIPTAAVAGINSRISAIIIREILNFSKKPSTPSNVLEDLLRNLDDSESSTDETEERLLALTESVRDLQTRLAKSGISVDQTEWSVVYEYIQMLKIDGAELVFSWAFDKLKSMSLALLFDLIESKSGLDDDIKISLLTQIDEEVIRLVTSSP